MMNYFLDVLKKYAVFNGRARRKEYWIFTLVYLIILIILMVIDSMITRAPHMRVGLLSAIFRLATVIPSFAVMARRMHDIGKSGWFMLIPIYNIVLLCRAGVTGENKYGADPKQTKTTV
jgi:uncharacterized membrane protein YhaH (DUF805 family)